MKSSAMLVGFGGCRVQALRLRREMIGDRMDKVRSHWELDFASVG